MDSVDYLTKLSLSAEALNKRFSDGNQPFQIITRLCEEAGELAQVVNHFEGSGIILFHKSHVMLLSSTEIGEPDKLEK